eukprot:7382835-Prymnesium_polylepis.1
MEEEDGAMTACVDLLQEQASARQSSLKETRLHTPLCSLFCDMSCFCDVVAQAESSQMLAAELVKMAVKMRDEDKLSEAASVFETLTARLAPGPLRDNVLAMQAGAEGVRCDPTFDGTASAGATNAIHEEAIRVALAAVKSGARSSNLGPSAKPPKLTREEKAAKQAADAAAAQANAEERDRLLAY